MELRSVVVVLGICSAIGCGRNALTFELPGGAAGVIGPPSGSGAAGVTGAAGSGVTTAGGAIADAGRDVAQELREAGVSTGAAGVSGTRGLGQSCTAAPECVSGNCIQGVCCNDQSCDGPCLTCAKPTREGFCLPRDEGTSCGDQFCEGNMRVNALVCDGLGACVARRQDCSPFLCDAAARACRGACTSDADCASSFRCLNGLCRRPLRAICTANDQCVSGLCVAGTCCETPCLPDGGPPDR